MKRRNFPSARTARRKTALAGLRRTPHPDVAGSKRFLDGAKNGIPVSDEDIAEYKSRMERRRQRREQEIITLEKRIGEHG